MKNSTTALSESEDNFLGHMMMWGSAGYPIRKVGSGRWIWDEFWGVKGAPTVYKTKRDAFASVERYIDVLIDRKAGRS